MACRRLSRLERRSGHVDDTALLLDPSRAVRRFQPSILNHLPSNPITHRQQTCAIWVPQDT
jgi:hypothetical protein